MPEEHNDENNSQSESPSHEDIITELQTENTELKNKILLTIANCENEKKSIKKIAQQENLENLRKFAKDTTYILDQIDLAIQATNNDKNIQYGIIMTKNAALQILEKHGIQIMQFDKNTKFDSNFHEAIEAVESDLTPGTITEITQPGYLLHSKILRAAKVKIAKNQS